MAYLYILDEGDTDDTPGSPISTGFIHFIAAVASIVCFPIGVFALLRAFQCRQYAIAGDRALAKKAKAQTYRLAFWAFFVGAIVIGACVLLAYFVNGVGYAQDDGDGDIVHHHVYYVHHHVHEHHFFHDY